MKLNKNDIIIKGINSIVENYCKENNVDNADVLKIQLVSEEFLTNILFPNFDGEVEFFISKKDADTQLTFSYPGPNYMSEINDFTFLALKLIKSKTKDIKAVTQENKTTVEFLI